MMHSKPVTKTIRLLKWIGVCLVVFLVLYWLAMTVATELLRHPQKTLSFLAGIESIKHWFFLMRFSLYAGFYIAWGWILRRCKQDISADIIVETRKVLLRFFIVYELFFGINIIAFLMR